MATKFADRTSFDDSDSISVAERFSSVSGAGVHVDETPKHDAYRDIGYTDPNIITGYDFWTDIKNALHKAATRSAAVLGLK